MPGEPFFRMREGEGEPNSETRIEVAERNGRWWRYRLHPVTGKKHQLRVHLAALGAGIQNDGFYPELLDAEDSPDDYRRPLAAGQGLRFDDPLSGEAYVRIRAAARLAGVGDRLASGMLAYVADPERMARFYEQALGLEGCAGE